MDEGRGRPVIGRLAGVRSGDCFRGSILLDAVDEGNAGNDPRKFLVTVEATPFPLGLGGELEDHRQCGHARAASLGLTGNGGRGQMV